MSKISDIVVFLIAVVILVLVVCGILKITGGNKQIIDLDNRYTKCITYIGNEKYEFEIKSWKDYDGEQLQITDKDGNVYLVSSFNTMLIKEK